MGPKRFTRSMAALQASPSGAIRWLLCSLLAIALPAGTPGQQARDIVPSLHEPIPYETDRPLFSAKLPKNLREISGLTTLDSLHVAAVQDEDGIVFVLQALTGEVVSEHRFGEGGDYEALEAVGERMYVLRSDGVLLELTGWRGEGPRSVVRHDTWLSSRFDTEGLALSRDGTSLLVACKEYPGRGFKGKRTVYAFELASRRLGQQPALVLDARAAESDLGEGTISRAVRRLLDIRRFKPSGISVHPISGEVYVVSSVSGSLAVFNAAGEPVSIVPLDKDLFPQPEGITFMPDGDLLISSEGDGRRARLVRFRYTPS